MGGSIALSDDGERLVVGAVSEDGNGVDADADGIPDNNNLAPNSGAVYWF